MIVVLLVISFRAY
ncbi:hypothetical protein OF865_21210 [Escherichia coli]|nr:hypothetical protein OF865_21210 [Escherichia coli]